MSMVAKLRSYPAMKNSGVEWLGEVPEHWEVRRIKTLFREKDQRSGDGQGLLLSLTRARGIVPQSETSNRMASASDLSKYKVCRQGDLVMNRMQAWSGMFAVSALDGLVSPDYSVFEATADSDTKAEYFEKLFRTPILVGQFARTSKGIGSGFNRLYTDDFGSLPATAPPRPEQNAIVRFIDFVDRRIRRYIRAKRRLIKLLEEQKQAIIHQAVTGQVDVRTGKPYPAYKPSCLRAGTHRQIELLGEVPEHWEVQKVKRCAKTISKGTTPSTEGREILDAGPVRFLKAENITSLGVQDVPLCFIDEETDRILKRSRLRLGDVLFVIAGATLGKTSIVSDDILPANTNQAVAFIRPNSRINSRYLEFWLQTHRIREQIWLNAVQSAQPNLSMANLGEFACPLPSPSEQTTIVEHLDQVTTAIDAAITHSNHEIDLLNEYRTRLIADVVTGKLDVREAAASLPDEPEESEAMDALSPKTDSPEVDEFSEAEHDE